MGIMFNAATQTFHLQACNTSYVIKIIRAKYLAHLYWGKRINEHKESNGLKFVDRAFSPNPDPDDRTFSLDTLPQEYPAYGNTDYRTPAYQIQLANGSTITDLHYKSYRIFKGKPHLANLPATYVENETEAETLEIELEDSLIGLHVILTYSVYESCNVITRNVCFVNKGQQPLKLLRALSMSVDFSPADFDLLQLSGAWSQERYIERRSLTRGTQSIESRRGASSHQHNPFIALLGRNADEDSGDVFGFNLVYSGNFLAQAEVDQFKTTRVSLGINPFDFSWLLEPGDSFQTPEAVTVYSANGLGEMSRIYHQLYRTRLCRGMFRDQVRPILANNWEATYFDFNAEKILEIAKTAQELGIELFVLDDGWFNKRNNDKTSLGDWFADQNKFPDGLSDLVGRVRAMELQFGLWFEPEMISVDSDLYRAHPDWCLHVPGRPRSEGRNQLILDFSRTEVCDYIIKVVSDILGSNSITYVKWDMNRHMTEVGSAELPPDRQRETAHRYMLGLYRVMEEITTAFPQVLFEGCSGGGGRFDPGILYYMPQIWTSDNMDPVCRIKTQYGTSLVYPPCTMGAHVAAVPNHIAHRTTPLKMRADVAMAGIFGYELDLTKFTEEDKELVKSQVAAYKEKRHLIRFGDFYRLLNPFAENRAAWMFVSKDKREALVAYFRVLAEPNAPQESIKLKGLDPELTYQVCSSELRFGGDELMYAGICIPELYGDFQSMVWRLKA